MTGNNDTAGESGGKYQRVVGWVLTLAAVAGVAGAGLWADQGEVAIAATLLVGGVGLMLTRAQLDGLVSVVEPVRRRRRAVGRVWPSVQVAKAGAIVFVLLVAVVGVQVAPFVGLFSDSTQTDGVASALPGDSEWSFGAGGSVESSPTVVDGTVYVGSNDGKLFALDTSDGTEQWSFSTGVSAVEPSPTVADGTVYVGSNDNNVYALDASDGTKQWNYTTGGTVYSSPTVADGTVYVGSNDGNLYALDASDGTEQWSFSTGVYYVESSPTVVDGTVYVGSGNDNVYALDASDGTEQWSFTTGGMVESSPTVSGGTVYVGSGDNNVYALDASDGTEQWNYTTGRTVVSAPTVADGTVYVGSRDYSVYALDASDGAEKWSFATGDRVYSSPTVADSTVYIGSDDGKLYALSASDGTEQWSYTANDRIRSSPTVADGTVYVGSQDNKLYAVEASDAGADSEGSRTLLGTLGHNGLFTADGSLGGGGSTLSGTVTDTEGNPIPDATVEADSGAATTTDDNGDYSLELDGGTYDITYDAEGFDPQTKTVTVDGATTQDVTLYKAGNGPFERTVGVCYEGNSQFQASTATAYWYEEYLADGRFTEDNAPEWVEANWGFMLEDGVYQDDSTYAETELHAMTDFNSRQNTTASGLVDGNGWYYELQIATDRAYLQFDGYTPPAETTYTELLFNPPFEDSASMANANGTEADCPETTTEEPLNFSWTPADPQTNRSVRFTPEVGIHDNYTWTIEKSDGTVEREGRRRTAIWTEPGSFDVTLTATVNGERLSHTKTVEVAQGTDVANDDDDEIRDSDDFEDDESVSDYRKAAHAAEFEFSPENPDVNQSVAFEANRSASADSYSWDIAGDATASGRSVSYVFGEEDYHLVELTATVNGTDATRYEFVKVGDGVPEAGGGGREAGWGPTAMGPCTTPNGEDGVYIEYWDPDYETEKLSYQLEDPNSDAYHEGTLTFDQPKGYVFTCVASDAYSPENPEDTNATLSDGSQTYDAGWSDRRGNEVGGAGGGSGGGGFVPADAGSDAPLWLTAIPAAAAVGYAVLRRRRGSDGTGGSAGGGGSGGGGSGPF